MPRLSELPTPCALVDVEKVDANTARMAERVRALGARLRPHVKTHKTPEAARLQVRGHFGGITVSTLAEGRFFAAAGFRDITWAVPIPPQKVAAAAALAGQVDALHLVVDSETAAAALESGAAGGRRFSVFLKVDCGYHRAGVDPGAPASLALARRLAGSGGLDFRGLLSHAGHSYDCREPGQVREVARQEREVVVGFAERLRREGIPVPEVSVGSTPTAVHGDSLEGITELRPGNYAFFDAFQAAIGSCALSDAAFSVLTTVIGSYPQRGRVVVDAGALALSKDPGPTHVDPGCGFGVPCETGGGPLPGLKLVSLSQEHGVLEGAAEALAPLVVGARLRVIPNHSCLAAALHDRYVAVRGEEVVGEWRPARGW